MPVSGQASGTVNARPQGVAVPDWSGAATPDAAVLSGDWVRLEALDPDTHAARLHTAFGQDPALWDYMPWGPFSSSSALHRTLKDAVAGDRFVYYAICDAATGTPLGKAAYLRVNPAAGSLEVGGITYAPALQRTVGATEAMILMMRWAFANGYRRYEWKCNALNIPSRRAAQRLGFSYEGVFRNHMVVKGHNRDTAWFAVTCEDWPALNQAYKYWLEGANFDAEGRQKESLSALTQLVRVADDPVLR